jgi:hypothetical protein
VVATAGAQRKDFANVTTGLMGHSVRRLHMHVQMGLKGNFAIGALRGDLVIHALSNAIRKPLAEEEDIARKLVSVFALNRKALQERIVTSVLLVDMA